MEITKAFIGASPIRNQAETGLNALVTIPQFQQKTLIRRLDEHLINGCRSTAYTKRKVQDGNKPDKFLIFYKIKRLDLDERSYTLN